MTDLRYLLLPHDDPEAAYAAIVEESKGSTTPFGTAPRTKSYAVKAIFEIGMTEFGSTFVFMPLAQSARLPYS